MQPAEINIPRKRKSNGVVRFAFHLFAGGGGGILADHLLGLTTIGAVEIEKYAREILLARQADGILSLFPIWDDVKTFRSDNRECSWFIRSLKEVSAELVICGGFP
jgi:DNA (cytosine-5)-methyltransferase 1